THRIACSKEAAIRLFGKKNVKKNNVIYLKNGIDAQRFVYNNVSRDETRDELSISSDCLVIGHIGRFSAEKNHDFIIDVFKKVSLQKKDCRLLLLGTGELQDKIKERVKILDLEEKVIFLGFQKDTSIYLSAMDSFIMPSIAEGLPLALVEAQTNDLNIVASTGVSRDASINNMITFLSLDDEINKWVEHIINTKKTRQDNLEVITINGFNIEQTVLELEVIYNNNHQ
ncbi:MAG: glycosyltransferase, partial [Bacilli bacterium]